MSGFPPANPLPAPLAYQYPPMNPIATIPLTNSTYETGDTAPPVTLSSSSTSVAPNTGVTQPMFGGRRRRKHSKKRARKNRRTRSRRRR
jgi:hypothetical protein